jgi:protein-S-isoprenylcysteine O-methyltransferase Ste14
MIQIGNFFFKYRNLLFILLYGLLFLPSPELFTENIFHAAYKTWPLIIGLFVTVLGQAIRGATIGLAYIVRGGKDKKVYAEHLVSTGIFSHCRNPLYVGNILMLLGVGILANSLIYVAIIMPLFLFIYQAIVLAEENFLRGKFGADFDAYCTKVNRWIPSLKGIGATFSSMEFNWKRWVLKEYTTQFIWLAGIALLTIRLYQIEDVMTNSIYAVIILAIGYGIVRYLKKSGKMTE